MALACRISSSHSFALPFSAVSEPFSLFLRSLSLRSLYARHFQLYSVESLCISLSIPGPFSRKQQPKRFLSSLCEFQSTVDNFTHKAHTSLTPPEAGHSLSLVSRQLSYYSFARSTARHLPLTLQPPLTVDLHSPFEVALILISRACL